MSFKERYLRGDCSIDMVNDYVEMWHGEGEIKKTLSEFLGLSQEEYVCWMISMVSSSVSPSPVRL